MGVYFETPVLFSLLALLLLFVYCHYCCYCLLLVVIVIAVVIRQKFVIEPWQAGSDVKDEVKEEIDESKALDPM